MRDFRVRFGGHRDVVGDEVLRFRVWGLRVVMHLCYPDLGFEIQGLRGVKEYISTF